MCHERGDGGRAVELELHTKPDISNPDPKVACDVPKDEVMLRVIDFANDWRTTPGLCGPDVRRPSRADAVPRHFDLTQRRPEIR